MTATHNLKLNHRNKLVNIFLHYLDCIQKGQLDYYTEQVFKEESEGKNLKGLERYGSDVLILEHKETIQSLCYTKAKYQIMQQLQDEHEGENKADAVRRNTAIINDSWYDEDDNPVYILASHFFEEQMVKVRQMLKLTDINPIHKN